MKNNKVDKPTEEEIISTLGRFKPHPSDRFYQQMRSAPWLRADQAHIWASPNLSKRFTRRHWQTMAVLGLMIIFFAVFIILTPSARVVAQRVVQYFVPAQSDKIAVQVTDTLPIAIGTSVPAGNFTLSFTQVDEIAGFQLKQIPLTDRDLVFSGAYHDPNLGAVALRYDGDGFTLILSQRRAGNIEEYASIGASAPIEPILVHGIPGEYVEGGWRVDQGEANKYPIIMPEGELTLGIYWDSELNQRIIRWQEGDMIYEILALGRDHPSKSELIVIAESVK